MTSGTAGPPSGSPQPPPGPPRGPAGPYPGGYPQPKKSGKTVWIILGVVIGAIILFCGAGLAVVAVVSDSGTVDDDPPSGSNADESGSVADDASNSGNDRSDDSDDDDRSDDSPQFGESYTWDNGLTVTIGRPTRFQPSDSAFGAEKSGTPLAFEVTLVNNTDSPYDASCDYVTVQSENREADQIFDHANQFNGPPQTKVLDSREAKFKLGFNVKNPKDLVLEYQPCDYALPSVLFAS